MMSPGQEARFCEWWGCQACGVEIIEANLPLDNKGCLVCDAARELSTDCEAHCAGSNDQEIHAGVWRHEGTTKSCCHRACRRGGRDRCLVFVSASKLALRLPRGSSEADWTNRSQETDDMATSYTHDKAHYARSLTVGPECTF